MIYFMIISYFSSQVGVEIHLFPNEFHSHILNYLSISVKNHFIICRLISFQILYPGSLTIHQSF